MPSKVASLISGDTVSSALPVPMLSSLHLAQCLCCLMLACWLQGQPAAAFATLPKLKASPRRWWQACSGVGSRLLLCSTPACTLHTAPSFTLCFASLSLPLPAAAGGRAGAGAPSAAARGCARRQLAKPASGVSNNQSHLVVEHEAVISFE